MRTLAVTLCAVSLAACGLFAQSPSLSCQDQGSRSGSHFCEVRESTVPGSSMLTVDGKQNGGVSIKGANRSDILIRSMVQADGNSAGDAQALGAQVLIHSAGGTVSADGPSAGRWSVTYEIFVPVNTGLTLTTRNGGVSVSGVESSIEFHAINGGISLKNIGGSVHGDTVNGGVSVTLAGARWNGQGMDVSTQNGGVTMNVPEHFSALLDIATVNGGLNVRLPNAQIMRGEHRVNMTLGTGGPLIRVHTQNGGVSISSNSAAA